MNIDIIINVLIPILGAITVYVAIPFFKSKTDEIQRQNIYFYTKLAVQAAEQIFNYKHSGADKKEYVIRQLQCAGIDISDEELDVMIEAAVQELNIIKKQL